MRRKHYRLIAMHLHGFYSRMVEVDPWRKQFYDMIECLADVLEEQNPRFDREKFMDAATGERIADVVGSSN